jgi:DNA replication initiation complex subunit (GINS family)
MSEESEVIITYETLYELLRREKYRTELQQVDPAFFENVVKYLTEKRAILESQTKKNSIFASKEVEKTQTQLRNIQKILKDLYEKRENKIIQAALFMSRSQNPSDTSAMLREEKALFNQIRGTLDMYREGVLLNLLQNKAPEVGLIEQKALKTEEKTDTLLVRVIENIPEFVGPDLKTYGPYQKDVNQELPNTIAQLLIQTNQAKNENS